MVRLPVVFLFIPASLFTDCLYTFSSVTASAMSGLHLHRLGFPIGSVGRLVFVSECLFCNASMSRDRRLMLCSVHHRVWFICQHGAAAARFNFPRGVIRPHTKRLDRWQNWRRLKVPAFVRAGKWAVLMLPPPVVSSEWEIAIDGHGPAGRPGH